MGWAKKLEDDIELSINAMYFHKAKKEELNRHRYYPPTNESIKESLLQKKLLKQGGLNHA